MPTPAECASGNFNGVWLTQSPGRAAVCVGAMGHTLAYAGGDALFLCGAIEVADQRVSGRDDPNPCPVHPETFCFSQTSPDGVAYTLCDGQVASFDGIPLDVQIAIPAGATLPSPAAIFIHGYGGNKFEWLNAAMTKTNEDQDVAKYHWNGVWFLSKGYAVVTYTVRGFGASCGLGDRRPVCVEGYTHLIERDFEIRDAQHLLSVLVDSGIADPDRLLSTGASQGGGTSWLLGTSIPWVTPIGATLQLAAAVPQEGWTDLLDSLAPNGRATDDVDQSASHSHPFGVPRPSYTDLTWLTGQVDPFALANLYVPGGRYNHLDPSETHSYFDGYVAFFSAGEPYGVNPLAPTIVDSLRGKSAYFADDYFAGVSAGTIEPVPFFAVSGWADGFFTPVETLQMYRKLRAADPAYPIVMAFGDTGHPLDANPPDQWMAINDLANEFVDAAIGGAPYAGPGVLAFETRCDDAPSAVFSATDWDALAPGGTTFTGGAGARTFWLPTDASNDARSDPFIAPVLADHGLGSATCQVSPSAVDNAAVWSWAAPAGGLTLLGLPQLDLEYSLTGIDATLALKLWDVAPDGYRTLVSRGIYRLSSLEGDPASGTLTTKLFGNAWRFAAGHRIELEVGQSDPLLFRPDSLPSAVSFAAVSLNLPSP